MPPRYQIIKTEIPQTITRGQWVDLDFDADDRIVGAGGPTIVEFQIHLDLRTASPRPSYLKGQFARDNWDGMGRDTTGTCTRAIPPKRPESWQSMFTHVLQFDEGKFLAYSVYIPGTGTVISPMRIVKAVSLFMD